MFLKARVLLLTFGLVNIFLASDPFHIFPNVASTSFGKLAITLIITASGVLIFGELMTEKQHKANIILFWLMAMLVFLGSLIYEIRDSYYGTRWFEYSYSLLLVIMGVLTYRVYNEEVTASTSNPVANEDNNEVFKPPPYEVKSVNVQIV
ncbi:uncharacterized protein LOC108150386 isoform X1 [Drosophila elegans]|uniref:uncharacterized protein LOC108150386 isoform X1 n=1 Tax=Drosophila elegans TaxID=30023 RepID=UPI0007E6B193|nr:uncharacterized protein LOC108150386 isoform X1 [Drosophila elegans]